MENKIASKELALRVRDIFRKNSGAPEEAVEEFLRNELQDIPRRQQLTAISKMRDQFFLPAASGEDAHCFDRESYAKLLSLFLGKRSEEVDHFSEETFEKLGASLNTVFDSLNEIISGINATFLGKSTETEETIRLVISANLDSRDEFKPLEQYLNQIKEAFVISHDAFQKAARAKMKEMLDGLSPANIAAQIDKGMKIGPFHKAEMYDIYCEKFKTIEKWLHSGIFTEALLREFEKQCQKSYLKKGGE